MLLLRFLPFALLTRVVNSKMNCVASVGRIAVGAALNSRSQERNVSIPPVAVLKLRQCRSPHFADE